MYLTFTCIIKYKTEDICKLAFKNVCDFGYFQYQL